VSSSSDTLGDLAEIRRLLGREPQGEWEVVVRTKAGSPVVLRNAPLLADGTPMPTRYWLIGEHETVVVGRLESDGGVNRAEAEVSTDALARTHERYAAERDANLPLHHSGPRPQGGVGGTRIGVKCLHAHYANWLAGNDDVVGEWVASHLGSSRDDYLRSGSPTPSVDPRPIAVIDVGTNSTNLLVVGADGHTLDRRVTVTRLGRGLAASNTLQHEGITATVRQIETYVNTLPQGTSVRIVGTEACRRATNASEFLDAVSAATGHHVEVVSGEREGRLSYAGAVSGLSHSPGATLVFDIGGGSTEVMYGDTQLRWAHSIPCGAVTQTEVHLHRDPPRPEELTNAIGEVTDHVDDIIRLHPEALEVSRVVGVAGTIVTVAAVELGLAEFDATALHGFTLSRDAAEDVFRTLATEALADRVHNPGLPRDRADVIVGGCCVLVALLRRLKVDELTVSTHNLLDGVVLEELAR
jgi:exopolyphosphatase/guanosine-5'-triphosphate,3'-diphosphate pyrophosphatase